MKTSNLERAPGDASSKAGSSAKENLTQEEVLEKNSTIAQIHNAISAWKLENIPEGAEFNKEKIGDLLAYLANEKRSLLDSVVRLFPDREKYIKRPAVKLLEGRAGEFPDIWLLGWRSHDDMTEETDIHDHVNSEAAVHVYKGTLKETNYSIDRNQWEKDNSQLDFTILNRDLSEGSTSTIPAPYIHLMSGVSGQTLAVSMHGYYPPLDIMNLFEERDGRLVKTGLLKKGPAGITYEKNND